MEIREIRIEKNDTRNVPCLIEIRPRNWGVKRVKQLKGIRVRADVAGSSNLAFKRTNIRRECLRDISSHSRLSHGA
jgi:hypothetical protein